MNKEKNSIKKLEKELTQRLFIRTFTLSLVFLVGIAILYFLGSYLSHFRIWYGNEFEYRVLKLMQDRVDTIVVIVCGAAIIGVLILQWKKTFRYLSEMLNATEKIYSNKSERIELSSELNEMENQMNQIRLNIQESEQAAREAEKRKNDLVVYLAHDLKTPLTSIIGYITLLKDEPQISEEIRNKYLSIAYEKAYRLENLINEFFDITRFSLSSVSLETGRINLTILLQQLVFEFQPILVEKELSISLNVDQEYMLNCDADKLQRVFDNLLRNAVNYSYVNSTIEISVNRRADILMIDFSNQGQTISEDKLKRLFEQFYRLDTSRSSKSGGSGLGLAIAKEIVELHGGTISANSENERIVFHIELPII